MPVTTGGGSGVVWEGDRVMSPLHALCDELGVDRIPITTLNQYRCSKKTGNCITYLGSPVTNNHNWLHMIRDKFLSAGERRNVSQ